VPATGVAAHSWFFGMSTQSLPPEPASDAAVPTSGATATPELEELKREKKRNKVRSAWISFVGRILAQFVGATASILLGMALLQKYQTAHANPADHAPAVTPVAQHPTPTARERVFSGQPSLAVLPLEAFSSDPAQKHLAAAMTDALITALAQVEGMRVISRTSSMNYQGATKALPDIGRELGVDFILEGSVVKAGNRARVTAQLINAATDEHVWARSYGRPARDTLAFQDAIAGTIVRDLTIAMKRQERQVLTKGGLVSGIRYEADRQTAPMSVPAAAVGQ
jgi:TolB-like protein